MLRPGEPAAPTVMVVMADAGPVTTAGVIAVANLEARIDGQVARATRGRLTIAERAELVELIALRGHVLGRVADAELAADLADELVAQAPTDARSFLARARTSGVFHRFTSALTDLDTAAAFGADRVELDAERAGIYQALGRYDEALAILRPAVDRHPDFGVRAALAGIHGERGEMDEAEHWFGAAMRSYRSTSPFPLAALELQRGRLWMEHDDLRRARVWCEAAVRRLPVYVPALGHLAEIEAALGESAAAVARLRPLAGASDDPDYATQLARIPGKEASMAKILYTAHARVTGGRVNGHGRTSDGELEVDLRVPEEMGGPGGGTNPEELFAVGYAACFEGALATVARRQRLDAGDATIDSAVSLFPTGDGAFAIAVTLDVSLPSVDRETAAGLVREAHQVCPYSNATRGNIPVDLLLSGEPI